MTQDGNRKGEKPMPEDFWQLVQAARNRAQAEVEKKREQVYQTFITEEVKSGKRVPMPAGFWQAIEGSFKSPPLTEPPHPIISEEQEEMPSPPQNIEIEKIEKESLLSPDYAERRDLSFKEAALLILKRENRPMTAKEIVSLSLSEGLLKSVGKTPDASLAGQIYTDIHRNRNLSPFVIVGPRTYALKPDSEKLTEAARQLLPIREQSSVLPESTENDLQNSKKMSYKQAALFLLERERRPMTAREIVSIAINEGLIESSGKTPDATLAGQIYTEMQRAGEQFPIKLVGPRTYGLKEWYNR
jgi:DNA-directed RNA polymerase delta subunit